MGLHVAAAAPDRVGTMARIACPHIPHVAASTRIAGIVHQHHPDRSRSTCAVRLSHQCRFPAISTVSWVKTWSVSYGESSKPKVMCSCGVQDLHLRRREQWIFLSLRHPLLIDHNKGNPPDS